MNSDYFSRAWDITWGKKYLWLLGLLAGLQFGVNAGENDTLGFLQGGAWIFGDVMALIPSSSLAVLSIAVSLLLWLIGLAARAGLIRETIAISQRKDTDGVIASMTRSLGVLLSIIVMQLLVWLPVIVLSVVVTLQAQQMVGGMLGEDGSISLPQSVNFGSIGGIVCGVGLLSIVLAYIDAFAFRSIVLGRLNPIRGIMHGLKTLGDCVGTSLITGIVCGIISIIVGIVIGIPLAAIGFALMGPTMIAMQECAASGSIQAMSECTSAISQSPAVIIPTIILSVVGAALASVWTTFQSATFTLLYRDYADMSGFE